MVDAQTGLDMGCGAGLYVAKWRSCGLSFAGYDANPHTEMLSTMLLPNGDIPCGVADLTEELEVEGQFDIVVCKDVLPYIPTDQEQVAIKNLAKLSGRFIVLSWDVPEEMSELSHREISEEGILDLMKQEQFVQEQYMTANLRVLLNRKNCCVLAKQG